MASRQDFRKVFVGGLSWDTDDSRLRTYFENYGRVVECFVSYCRDTGKPRGFGFVVFEDTAVADRVVLNKHTIDRREVDVKHAMPRHDYTAPRLVAQGAPPPPDAPPSAAMSQRKVFVGGLPSSVVDANLRHYFEQYGPVLEAQVMIDHQSKRPRGFGFRVIIAQVTFADDYGLETALSVDSKQTLHGKEVEVKRAVPRDVLQPDQAAAQRAQQAIQQGRIPMLRPEQLDLRSLSGPYSTHYGPTTTQLAGFTYADYANFAAPATSPASSLAFQQSAQSAPQLRADSTGDIAGGTPSLFDRATSHSHGHGNAHGNAHGNGYGAHSNGYGTEGNGYGANGNSYGTDGNGYGANGSSNHGNGYAANGNRYGTSQNLRGALDYRGSFEAMQRVQQQKQQQQQQDELDFTWQAMQMYQLQGEMARENQLQALQAYAGYAQQRSAQSPTGANGSSPRLGNSASPIDFTPQNLDIFPTQGLHRAVPGSNSGPSLHSLGGHAAQHSGSSPPQTDAFDNLASSLGASLQLGAATFLN